MSEGDLGRELETTLRRLDLIAGKARKLSTALEKKTVRGADEDEVVTAIVNGHGEIISLELSDAAMRYPTRLGDQVTVAIRYARQAAQSLTEKARAKYLSELPEMSEAESIALRSAKPTDYGDIEFPGSPHMRNRIAEKRERLFSILKAKEDLDSRRIKHKIGEGAGFLEIDLAGTFLKVEIDPDAPRLVGLHRLAHQIRESLRKVESYADRIRKEKLEK